MAGSPSYLSRRLLGVVLAAEAHTHQHHRLQMIRTQQISNHLNKLFHIVAQPARTKLPEVSEILAQYACLQSQ